MMGFSVEQEMNKTQWSSILNQLETLQIMANTTYCFPFKRKCLKLKKLNSNGYMLHALGGHEESFNVRSYKFQILT